MTALPQSINNNYYVWNNNAPLNRSTWRKYVNENLVPLSNNTNQTFNLNVSNQDFNSTYLADLKLNCKISQLYQTEFDGTLNGPTNWIIKENSDIIIAPLDSVNYVFSHWIDNYDRSNSRVITPTDNTTYTAFYKAHLLTNSTSATSNNNQRKIIQDSNASWAMVYVSSNNVWLSRSTDGVNWGNEILISDGYGEVKSNPTISASGVVAKIVWQELSWSGGGGFETAYIFMRSFNLIDNTLSTTTLVDNFNPDVENFESNPVLDGYWDVMGNSDSYMVAWKEPDGIKLKYYNSSTGWSGKTNLSGTNSNSNNPSIVNYNGSIFFLCWEDRYYNKIKFIEASYSPSWYFSSISEISPSNWESNFRPQMTLVSGNKPTIVWTSRNNIVEGGASVHIRQRIGSTWQNITSFSQVTTESLNPVIGDYYGVNRFEVLWNIGNTVYKASYNGTSWTGPTTITTSGGAGININRNGTTKTKAIWRKSNNTIAFGNIGDLIPPVEISVETELKLSKEDSNDVETFLPYKLNRHAIVNLQNVVDSSVQGSVCFEIAGINYLINNSVTKIDYSSIEDNVLSSELFTINDSRMELVFNGAIYGLGLELNESILSSIKEPLAKVVLKESNTNEVLENIWVNNASMLSHVQNKTFGEFRKEKINLNKHLGKTVYLEVEMLGKSKNILPLIVDDYLILSDTVRKGILNKYSGNIFSDYTLLQNYPNPFNPNTTISFFIPQNQFVTLKIYSSLGEEIMSVINKDLEQGYHSVVINMNNEPSGVYFYSLSAGNYKDTKKLILLK